MVAVGDSSSSKMLRRKAGFSGNCVVGILGSCGRLPRQFARFSSGAEVPQRQPLILSAMWNAKQRLLLVD